MPGLTFSLPFQHGQSDNLSLLALIDPANLPAPGAAVRWRPRYAVGLPPSLTLYSRPAFRPTAQTVSLTSASAWAPFIRWARTAADTITIDAAGFHLPQGVVRIQFTRPVIFVELFGAAGSSPAFTAVSALHCPFTVGSLGPATQPNSLGSLSANVIDAIELNVSRAGVLTQLQVIPLGATQSSTWSQVTQLNWAQNQYPGATAANFVDQRQLISALFDPSNATPMAQRTLTASGADGTLSLPELSLLSFASYGAATARAVGFLLDVNLPQSTTPGALDYAVVGQWPGRAKLPGNPAIDFVQLQSTGHASLASPYALPNALLWSPGNAPFSLVAATGTHPAGLQLGAGPVWIVFSTPVQVFEFFPDPNILVEATAFATTDDGFGQRAVDWLSAKDLRFATLCADRIDAICLYGPNATLAYFNYAATDPALASAPSAAIGSVTALAFAAGQHALPAAPTPVTAVVLPDPVLTANPSNALPPPRSATQFNVGICFPGTTPGPALDYGPQAYAISRGPSTAQQTQSLVPVDTPLVLSQPADSPASPSATAPQDPWSATPSTTENPPATPYRYIDSVDTGGAAAGVTEVYGVRALDIFGRPSAPAYSPSLVVAGTPPPPPINLNAHQVFLPHPVGNTPPMTFRVGWTWPPDPALGSSATIQGFKVYAGPSQPARGWRDGTIATVTESATGETPAANGLPTFHVATTIDATGVDPNSLPLRPARVGSDHYVVCDGEAYTDSAGKSRLRFRLYVNLSTPQARPATGDGIRLFDTASDTVALAGPALYGNRPIAVAATSLSCDVPVYATPAFTQLGWPAPDAHGVSRLIVGVSAYNAAGESAVCGPLTLTRVDTRSTPPPVPLTQSEADQFTEPPDAFGHCRYAYPAFVLPSGLYHVYRANDAMLLAIKNKQAASALSAPAQPYAAPVAASDFQAIIASTATNPSTLSNLQLHALANLVGVESAFEQITQTPWSIPANAAQPTTPLTANYLDSTLPGGGTNRYVYRLRSVSASGELGAWGWASPPVRLYPTPPVRPTLAGATVSGYQLRLSWNANPETQVDRYRIYYALDEVSAQDERGMKLLAEIAAADAAGFGLNGKPGALIALPAGARVWLRLVAVGNWPAPIGKYASLPSDAVTVASQSNEIPAAPFSLTVARTTSGRGTQVTVTFTPLPSPALRYQLWRQPKGGDAPLPVGPWLPNPAADNTVTLLQPAPVPAVVPPSIPPATLVDSTPLDASVPVEYLVACTNDTGRIALSPPASP